MNTVEPSGKKPIEQLFRALSDRARLRILLLLETGELCVGDIVSSLEIPQANVSRHLGYLLRAGLVTMRSQGLWRFYQLNGTGSPIHEQLLGALSASRSAVSEAAIDLAKLNELTTTGGCCPIANGKSTSRGNRK